MFKKENFNEFNFDKNLVAAVGNRLDHGLYTDAILQGTKYLTQFLRDKGDCEGDGASLVGQVLGGTPPKLPINKGVTVSEKDEQKGIEQLLRGYYMGIRNPRTHEVTEDTEEFCMRVLVILDTLLKYINVEVEEFDITPVVDKIFDPHFVPNIEYAQALIANVPHNKLVDLFINSFDRRSEGKTADIKFAFNAIYQLISGDDEIKVTEYIGNVLRETVEDSDIANIFRLLKPSAWQYLQTDVRMRMENIIIKSCESGRFDVYANAVSHGVIGTWGNTFGRYFTRINDLGKAIISRLKSDWYTQNYIAYYYIYSIPSIITESNMLKELADQLAYASIGNKAKVLRDKLLDVVNNYPAELKGYLKTSIQERRYGDEEYADKLLSKINQ
ncbi:TIGR02391 family protein [Aeromonas dhakensis]|uniref:TIGR02391 family protein n=1 Tax=Aeromonas dhakensis TaxID=196024 RepID=UPI0028DACFFB|nr:TIGR02391 family protein [Aeromonas dhakensis]